MMENGKPWETYDHRSDEWQLGWMGWPDGARPGDGHTKPKVMTWSTMAVMVDGWKFHGKNAVTCCFFHVHGKDCIILPWHDVSSGEIKFCREIA